MSDKVHTYLLVGLGGSLGAALRAMIINRTPAIDPIWVVVGINIVGCAVLAFFLTRWSTFRDMTPEKWHSVGRPFVATGVLGGFTTTSTFAVATVELLQTRPLTAVLYVILSVIGGYVAFYLVGRKDVIA